MGGPVKEATGDVDSDLQVINVLGGNESVWELLIDSADG